MNTINKKCCLTFRKTVFILFSIIKSGSFSAYYVLWIKGLKILLLPIDLIFSLLEKPFLSKIPKMRYPIVFVVGIHRTGSTFVSQALADELAFAPLGNYASIFPRSKIIIHKLLKGFYKTKKTKRDKKHKSYYGISRGFFSIGDCYEIWDKWMGKDHYNKPNNLTTQKKKKMADYFRWLQYSWNGPVITKNNRNSLLIKTIHESIPNAFFILVQRNPEDVIQSTMQASRDFFGDDKIIWGLKPEISFSIDNYKDKLDAYCHQYLDLEEVIHNELHSIPEEDYHVVQYEKFCENPEETYAAISDKLTLKYNIPLLKRDNTSSSYQSSKRLFDKEHSSEIATRIKAIRKNKT